MYSNKANVLRLFDQIKPSSDSESQRGDINLHDERPFDVVLFSHLIGILPHAVALKNGRS
jgi:hypothetical protein